MKEDVLRGVARPAAAFLPELARLEDRHLELQSAGTVHLLAHDPLGLAVGAQAERCQRVDAGGDAAHHAGAGQENVGDRLRVARNLPDGLEKIFGPAHVSYLWFWILGFVRVSGFFFGPTFSTRRRLLRTCCITRSSSFPPRVAVFAFWKEAFASSSLPAAR